METTTKMKLELKHLAPYLPYSLKLEDSYGNKYNVAWMSTKNLSVINIKGFGEVEKNKWSYASGKLKPILRPLSDLKNKIKELRLDSVYIENASTNRIEELATMCDDVLYWSYSDFQILLQSHFDVFGLIEKGLAININTLEK